MTFGEKSTSTLDVAPFRVSLFFTHEHVDAWLPPMQD